MEACVRDAALTAALEAIPAAAFIVGPEGQVARANAAGRAALTDEARAVERALADAVLGLVPLREFTMIELSPSGAARHHLVVTREAADARQRAAALARRWGLTQRQTESLVLAARGDSNKAIAAEIGCAEVTVELHMRGLFKKAGVANRAALVAWFWTAE
jgi:DNA-binding CsgD family transcriptional regulator